MPKLPAPPSPQDIAAAQDRISQERQSKQLLIEKQQSQNEASNNLAKALKRKRGRGSLITKRGGSSYLGIKDEALGPQESRSLLG